ncbi:Uncharacterised protein [Psychrobacter phenylpyruvicus]|uniref:Uncharacterized protein n=2 Tax=Psychrobacter phenylpyruvicus TaxID=29432 RepID=A0A379LIY1_9GAMM|nr:Uncharacterised protein [Psychrobacter phenylpyruvicus]
MTNSPRLANKVDHKSIKSAANKSVNQAAKKAESYLGVKSAILMLSIVGTMGGWLVLLNQEDSYAQVTDESGLSFEQMVADTNLANWDDEAAKPMAVSMTTTAGESLTNNASNQSIDINQLRQVNTVTPVPNQPVRVVATTQSSR